jgi:thioredoxin reductase (NADPH)
MGLQAQYDAIVLGTGPAGVTAGIYLARFQLKTAIIGNPCRGVAEDSGNPETIPVVYHNVPGFPEGISCSAFVERGLQQAKEEGCTVIWDDVIALSQTSHQHFIVQGEKSLYTGQAIFYALGLRHGWPTFSGSNHYVGHGVYLAVDANACEASGAQAAIIGHDDYSAVEAIRLHSFAERVFLLADGQPLELSDEVADVLSDLGIDVIPDAILALQGDGQRLTHIDFVGGRREAISVVFLPEHWLQPQSQLARQLGVTVDAQGYIQVNERFETNIGNVYAMGDVTSRGPEQVITACYHGMQAAWAFYEGRFHEQMYQLLRRGRRVVSRNLV